MFSFQGWESTESEVRKDVQTGEWLEGTPVELFIQCKRVVEERGSVGEHLSSVHEAEVHA